MNTAAFHDLCYSSRAKNAHSTLSLKFRFTVCNAFWSTLFCVLCFTLPTRAEIDLNSNGLSDVYEEKVNGGMVFDAGIELESDWDCDGQNLAQEAIAGTSPFDAASRLQIVDMNKSGEIRFRTILGKVYQLYRSIDLVKWDVEMTWLGTDNDISYTPPPATTQFYKLAVSDVNPDGDMYTSYEEGFLGGDPETYEPNIDAETIAYASINAIGSKATVRISRFFHGLDTLGLRGDFVDGACWRQDSHKSNGNVLRSLRGRANLTIQNGCEYLRHGMQFDGVDDWAKGTIPALVRGVPRTLFFASSGDLHDYTPYTGRCYHLGDAYSSGSVRLEMSNSSLVFGGYDPGPPASSVSASLMSARQRSAWAMSVVSDSATGLPNSFTWGIYPDNLFQQKTGIAGPATVSGFVVGATPNGSLNSGSAFSRRLVPGWLLFQKELSPNERDAVNALCNRTLWPRWRLIIEGDSISNDTYYCVQEGLNSIGLNILRGANIDLVNISAGGERSDQGLAQLGGGNGFNPAHQSSEFPVVAWIGYGANDLGILTVEQWWANMKQIIAYAKAKGMKVVVPTITRAMGSPEGSAKYIMVSEANAILRNAAGSEFDALVDVDAMFTAVGGIEYFNDSSLFRDGLHYSRPNSIPSGYGGYHASKLLGEIIDGLISL